jgi:hypothetical protein
MDTTTLIQVRAHIRAAMHDVAGCSGNGYLVSLATANLADASAIITRAIKLARAQNKEEHNAHCDH